MNIFLEHLVPTDADLFLRDCLRVLRPGGTIRLSVPDGRIYLKNYFEDRDWLLARRGGRFDTPMEVVNEVFRQGSEHLYCYDAETLVAKLSAVGFDQVTPVEFDTGNNADLCIDQESRRFESLYVEGVKSIGAVSKAENSDSALFRSGGKLNDD